MSAPLPPESADVEEREQSFLSHLVELRARLLRAVLAVLGVFVCLIPFANRIYAVLAAPLLAKLPAGAQMVAIDVASPFFAPIKLAFFVALVVAMPVVLYQLWAFVAPGLYKHEQKLARPLLVSATLLFYGGCAFAYFLVLPVVFGFLTGIAPEGVAVMTDISRYLDFVLVLFLAFGFSFEVPVAVVILVTLGWVSIEQLKAARSYVIVAAFVIAAVITPPDVVSQLMLAIPMCLLYEVGLVAARMLARRARQAEDATSAETRRP
jgi:sec-independent protein translocase protein TatC